jgi:hypothetical protein
VTLRKLQIAVAAYAVLALAAYFLTQGQVRLVVWIVLGGLAVKSWAAYKLLRQP